MKKRWGGPMAISGPGGYNGRSISAEARRIGKGRNRTPVPPASPTNLAPSGPQPLQRRVAIDLDDPMPFAGKYWSELATTVVLGTAITGSYVSKTLLREIGGEASLLTNERRVVLWQREGSGEMWNEDRTIILGTQALVITSGSEAEGTWVVVGPPGGPVFGIRSPDAAAVETIARRVAAQARHLGGPVKRERPRWWARS